MNRSARGLLSILPITVLVQAAVVGPPMASAQLMPNERTNAACPEEKVFFDPGNGEDIVLPEGFRVSVFRSGLNFPTAIAFRGNKEEFDVFVLESGRGLPSRCNDNEDPAFGGKLSSR